jgi:hypothetical protein
MLFGWIVKSEDQPMAIGKYPYASPMNAATPAWKNRIHGSLVTR